MDGVVGLMGTRKKQALEQFNRDNIIDAAKELFELKGVDATTMDDIAAHADYSKSTIYVYFKSKEDIYNQIVKDYMNVLTGELETCINNNSDFEETYFRICDCLVNFEEKYPRYYASLMGEENATNSRKKTSIINQDIGQELRDLLSSMIQKGVEKKVLRKDIELQPTVLYVWSAISGIIQVADRKKDILKNKLNMERDEYLKYSFRTFYESLVRR